MAWFAMVIPIIVKRELKWFFDSVGKPVYYYPDLLDDFEIVEDAGFACGFTFACKSCGLIASYIREDWSDLFKSWIVIHVICGSCGKIWKVETAKPVYVKMFEDWDLDEDCSWEVKTF